jgi:hypothetical protein
MSRAGISNESRKSGILKTEDKKLVSYIRKKLKEPWRGFVYSEVQFLFGKLREAGAIR